MPARSSIRGGLNWVARGMILALAMGVALPAVKAQTAPASTSTTTLSTPQDQTTQPGAEADFTWTAEKGNTGAVLLNGNVPDAAAQSDLLKAAGPSALDATELAPGAPKSFAHDARLALQILAKLKSGHIAYAHENWRVQGTAPSYAAGQAVQTLISDEGLEEAGWQVSLNVPAPTHPLANPFTFSAQKAEGGITLFGHVPDASLIDDIKADLKTPVDGTPDIAEGAPTGFALSARAGMKALSDLQSGRLGFDGSVWTLTGQAADAAAKSRALAQLDTAGKAGGTWTHTIAIPTSPLPADLVKPAKYVWQADKADDGTITITGTVPSAPLQRFLQVHAGPDKVTDKTSVRETDVPDGFIENTLKSLNALSFLESGKAGFDGEDWRLSGRPANRAGAEAAFDVIGSGDRGATGWSIALSAPPAPQQKEAVAKAEPSPEPTPAQTEEPAGKPAEKTTEAQTAESETVEPQPMAASQTSGSIEPAQTTTTTPAANETEAPKSEAVKSEAVKSEAVKSEAATPEANGSETEKTGAASEETVAPVASKANQAAPQASEEKPEQSAEPPQTAQTEAPKAEPEATEPSTIPAAEQPAGEAEMPATEPAAPAGANPPSQPQAQAEPAPKAEPVPETSTSKAVHPAVDEGAADYVFLATREAEGPIVLSGDAPSAAAANAFGTMAGDRPTDDIKVRDGAPTGFVSGVIAGLKALAHLDNGALSYADRKWHFSGKAFAAEDRAEAEMLMAPFKGRSGWTVDIRPTPPIEVCKTRIASFDKRNAILFGPGSARLTAESEAAVDELAGDLALCPKAIVHIEGHTDSDGNASANLALSVSRAEAVSDALIARGIAETRLYSIGYGETLPVASNDTRAGKRQNRRIVVTIVDGNNK